MITQMKKISVITIRSARTETLQALRDLGVVHVFTDRTDVDSGDQLREQKNHIDRAISIIPSPEARPKAAEALHQGDAAVDPALDIAQELIESADRRAQLEDEQDRLQRELERLEPWGELDPQVFADLRDRGVEVRLFEAPADKAREILSELPNVTVLSQNKRLVRAVAVALGSDRFPEGLAGVPLPDRSTGEIREALTELDREMAEIDAEAEARQKDLPLLLAAQEQLEQDLEFARVAQTMEHDRALEWITGFVPFDQVDAVTSAAKENGWGVVVRDPSKDEHVPTQLRNPKPVRIIQPVFDLLGTVPGYRELDISFFFLLFFVVFFAMIIGDAGYGAILLGGTIYTALKARAAGRPLGNGSILMIVLSSATVVWGAITGNWFGYAPFNNLPVFRSLVIPGISIDSETSTEMIQYMCFIIGTVHLSIAHIWKFLRGLRERPRIAALAQLGWLSMVLGLYYLVLQLVIDPEKYPMPDFALPLIAGGLAAVIIFGEQQEGKGFLSGVGRGVAGIITTILDSISAFSDIISYIRLFAVGLATLAIAEAFNSMAGGVAEGLGGVGGIVAAVLILFLGHTLNLAMGALSVVVHGVRLNMLEFSGHLGMEWTGVEYTPFKTR
ncbi:V/A-type H+-transporting ATPase subunit I [Alkalispirochaeta americana]|uniref:V/A-type H+-transporting ATPase subunit I n=1 Tax=Alkalispirochaeta americana TaxID=159291 RepID=A0A1N6P2P2_9SPIO|nr:V-type ATP synthase subunit I [Alkalispirochaeta americana]SIP98610.1 V/A-type H+-transporting ATPase subunit I [Alkalispirochaeta americana]